MNRSKKPRMRAAQIDAPQNHEARTHSARGLKVRAAKASDVDALVSLVAELTAERAELAPGRAPAFTAAVAKRDVLGRNAKVKALVATLEDRVVAYVFLSSVYDSSRGVAGLNVTDIYINAEGQRKSVGRTLMAAAAAEAKRQGRAYLSWTSKAWDVPAHDSYRRLGALEEPVMAHRLPLDKVPRFVSEGETMMPAKGLRKRRPART